MTAEPRQVIKQNLEIARRILFIFEIKRRLDELPPIFGGILSEIRRTLSSRVDDIKVASLPLVLVFVASCLENYLKEITPAKKRIVI